RGMRSQSQLLRLLRGPRRTQPNHCLINYARPEGLAGRRVNAEFRWCALGDQGVARGFGVVSTGSDKCLRIGDRGGRRAGRSPSTLGLACGGRLGGVKVGGGKEIVYG